MIATNRIKFLILLLSIQTPGPAAYKAVDPYIYKEKPPQFSMTGRNFTPGEAAQKPGPGAYYPERVRGLILGVKPHAEKCSNIFYHS